MSSKSSPCQEHKIVVANQKKNHSYKTNSVTETEARNIGTAFLRNKNFDLNDYGGKDKLGGCTDYTIFFVFSIVAEDGDSYIGGRVLLIDKKTNFCLLAASSPNFYEYHVKLFRIMVINQLYDSKIDLANYQKKKSNIDFGHYIQAIFLLVESYPENYNVYSEFLDILTLLDDEDNSDEIVRELNYKSISFNTLTLEAFFIGLEKFKSSRQIIEKIGRLEKVLLRKDVSISVLSKRYESLLAERKKEIEEFKEFIRKENEK